MSHKLLFLAVFFFAWGASPALAEDSVRGEALAAVGTPYVRGGETPQRGFDCSGLVFYVYGARGVRLPRTVAGLKRAGRRVALKDLAPGDLVFYNTRHRPYSHVGIYVGHGRFVHAPRPGKKVRVDKLDNPYWRARFSGARRVGAGA